MPLWPSKSKKAFSHNVATEMDAGKPQKQAVAIAYHEAGEKKMAKGGMCSTCGMTDCMEHGGAVEDPEMDQAIDDEINDGLASEFMDAMDKKDKKGMLESLRALISNHKE